MPDQPLPRRHPKAATPTVATHGHYAELHCRTNYSFLEGASHPDELVNLYNDPEYAEQIESIRKQLVALRQEVQDDSDVSLAPAEFRSRFRNTEAL